MLRDRRRVGGRWPAQDAAKAKHLSGAFYAAVGANVRVNFANCLAAKSPKLNLK